MRSLLNNKIALALWLQRRQRQRRRQRSAVSKPAMPPTPVIAGVLVEDSGQGGLLVNIDWTWDPQGWDDTYQSESGVGGVFEVMYEVEGTQDGSSWLIPCPGRHLENSGFYPVEDVTFLWTVRYRHKSPSGVITYSQPSVPVLAAPDCF
jgi:hypothetical protein